MIDTMLRQLGFTVVLAASVAGGDVIAPSIDHFAVLAGGNFSADRNVTIAGPIGAAGNIHLDRDGQVGSVIGMGNVSFDRDVAINGDVAHHGSYWADHGTTVTGSVTDGAAAPHTWILPQASVPAFDAASGSNWYDKNSDVTLNPGRYGSLSVSKQSTVRLSAGVYDFANAWFDKDVTVVADTSAGAVTVRISGGLSTGKQVRFTDGGEGLINLVASGNVYFGRDSSLDGSVQSFGNASFDRNNTVTGSIHAAGNVWLDRDAQVLGRASMPANAPSSPGGSQPVPEPASAVLLFASAALLAARHRTQRTPRL